MRTQFLLHVVHGRWRVVSLWEGLRDVHLHVGWCREMRLVSLSSFPEIIIKCRRAPLHILLETSLLSLVAVASLRA